MKNRDILALKKELKINQSQKVITGLFRFSDEKQPLLFLEVAKQIIGHRKDTIFIIGGQGDLKRDMRQFVEKNGIEDNIRFVGVRRDVATILSCSTLLLLCSRHEGLPNVLLEAQYWGCPVVTTRAGGAEETVIAGQTGFIADVGNDDQLVHFCLKILRDERLRNEMSKKCSAHVRKNFSVEAMVDLTNDLMEKKDVLFDRIRKN